jgi:glycosyltransferase involved in cell wall biosynthesis
MPKVSVIIPTYNRGIFLKEAIVSVLNQRYQDFELIVIDDGSSDCTQEIVQKYPRVIYKYQSRSGVSKARNEGIKIAQGEYIAFLDSDDLWDRNKLWRQMEVMKEGWKISYTDEIWLREGVRVNPKKKHRKYSGFIFDKLLPLCIISPSSCMIKREVLEDVGYFDETLPVCEDYDLWLRIGRKYEIKFIEEKLIIKRGGHPEQLSKSMWGLDRFRVKALEKILKEEKEEKFKEMIIKELLWKCKILITGYTKRGKYQEAKFYKNLSDQYAPFIKGV